ncbi:UDP-galactopyranose mutase [Cyanobium sp. Morenito 9A2]|uniref:UDP-galactopyranose/dTDP-fucopyranose mutase family protein n=1 Tax=Cyanobium sp. Morenito 9A2 TaxID=2823718 RepID=UPI0020CBD3CD|nr:FAD-dependent oxidoreductase [Cyanobium sp. Morenito 9A2]MCP9849775.1 NAD(P)-binding protein [Cyanobium sp. Morenito 9A2]
MTRTARVLVVGAGFSGAVVARELAEAGHDVLVIDARDHLAGNCHTERDEDTAVLVHRYGPHIFNTNNEMVWCYMQRFGTWMPYTNRVKASIPKGIYSLPINLHTINQFYGLRLHPKEARTFLASRASREYPEPTNFEEQALSLIGEELYGAFFYGYTRKQWGCEPKELPASILKRIPVRFNYNDNYYATRHQGLPLEGYTEVIRRILDHPAITVELNTDWEPAMKGVFRHVVYTGLIDQFFGCEAGALGYRTVFWTCSGGVGDLQGNAVINHCDLADAFTRVHEHKHFAPWEEHERSLLFTEYSKETETGDIPYYPKRLAPDLELLATYQIRAAQEPNVTFLGRLATYRYLNMDAVVAEALERAPLILRQLGRPAA